MLSHHLIEMDAELQGVKLAISLRYSTALVQHQQG